MLKAIRERLRQGMSTAPYPERAPELPPRYRGLPRIDAARCGPDCRACADACPTRALTVGDGGPRLDVGRCLFCQECVAACPAGALTHSGEYRMAARRREDLVVGGGRELERATALDAEMRRLFGRSLRLRQVSAGGCNGCEVEVNVLGTVVFDLGRFGIQFVASPRHADGLLVTGPVTAAMREPLRATWQAVPTPKIVVAVGACAISGGPYAGHPEAHDGADSTVPVDLHVPGCPPHPYTILDGLLRLLGRIG